MKSAAALPAQELADKAIAALSIPDLILPCQTLARRGRSAGRPEQKLMLALVLDGLSCLVPNPHELRRAPDLQGEAYHWFFDRYQTDALSFETACETLSLDPDWLRPRILAHLRAGTLRELVRCLRKYPVNQAVSEPVFAAAQ